MSRTLPLARDEFNTAMSRDTVKPERPRFLAVLDALIAWSLARPTMLKFHVDEGHPGVVSFERVGSKAIFWSASARRSDVPKLELLPRASRALTPEERANATSALNAHSREELAVGDPLRIGFGALKNEAGRTAVLSLMEELLAATGPAAAVSRVERDRSPLATA